MRDNTPQQGTRARTGVKCYKPGLISAAMLTTSPTRRLLLPRLLLCAAWLALPVQPASAQTLWGTATVGMTEAALQTAYPALKKVARPNLGPQGLRGLWMLPHDAAPTLSPLRFDTVFFFRNHLLLRVEQAWVAPNMTSATPAAPNCRAQAGFENFVSLLRPQHGDPLMATDAAPPGSISQSATWVADGTDVVASVLASDTRCQLRVVYKPQITKDASEL
jgi:hypothetical protein